MDNSLRASAPPRESLYTAARAARPDLSHAEARRRGEEERVFGSRRQFPVTVSFELKREFRAAGARNPAIRQYMDEIGLHIIE